jgi:hypothetical protein
MVAVGEDLSAGAVSVGARAGYEAAAADEHWCRMVNLKPATHPKLAYKSAIEAD